MVIFELFWCPTIDTRIQYLKAIWPLDLNCPGAWIADFHVIAGFQRVEPCEHVTVRMDIPKPVFRQAEHHSIAGNSATVMTHQGITSSIYYHGADGPREHIVKERRRIRSTNFQRDLRYIENACLGAQHPVLLDDGALKSYGRQPPFMVAIRGGQVARRLEPWRTHSA